MLACWVRVFTTPPVPFAHFHFFISCKHFESFLSSCLAVLCRLTVHSNQSDCLGIPSWFPCLGIRLIVAAAAGGPLALSVCCRSPLDPQYSFSLSVVLEGFCSYAEVAILRRGLVSSSLGREAVTASLFCFAGRCVYQSTQFKQRMLSS